MKTLGLFETKNRFSELCDDVARNGDPLVVTRHGKPLVRIVPYEGTAKNRSVWDSVEECQSQYGPIKEELTLPLRENSANRPNPLA